MWKVYKQLYDLLEPRERRQAALLFCLILFMALLVMSSVASVMPFVAVLANPRIVETNRYVAAVYQKLGFTNPHDFLFFLGLFLLAAVLLSTAFKALTSYAMLRFSNIRQYTLSQRLFKGYLQRYYEWFLGRHTADLAKSLLSEVQQVIVGGLVPAMQLVSQAIVTALIIVLLVVVDPYLAMIVSLILGTFYFLIFWASRKYLTRIGEGRLNANRERFRIGQEVLGGIKDVKMRGMEDVFLRRFKDPSLRLARYAASGHIIAQMPQYALHAIGTAGILLIVEYQLYRHNSSDEILPIIALYAFAGYRLMPAVQRIYQSVAALRFSGPAIDSLHRDLQAASSELGDKFDGYERLPPLAEGIRLEKLFYRYPNAQSQVLYGVDLTIPAKATVGFVGSTGAGKTTAADVLLGLLRPESGQLVVDGTPITDETRRRWRRCLGYVPQHIFLVDATVAENIAFGIPSEQIDFEAVEQAARAANLHNFVVNELEQGYQTMIGERGIRLSGGQRQRVGIARALYHNPDVLIMDEATSALDNLTEKAVMEAVMNLGKKKTIVLVAHRLSTVRRCDIIFMFEQGRIIASGSYDELVDNSEHFRAMALVN